MDNRVVSYAQNREDVILAGFFPEDYVGFYVDVGANHPVYDSVTKYFYERGWRGINIEANKKLVELLKSDRPEDINICLGVSSKTGVDKITLYENGDGLSTMSPEMQKEHKGEKLHTTSVSQTEIIETDTLKNVFKKHKVTKIDFLKIDVEGFEYEVIQGNDWSAYRPRIICIEANHIIKDWRPLLSKAKYNEVFFDGLNSYYVAEEASNLAESFSYVKSLLGKNILSLKWNQELLHQISLRRGQELENQALQAQRNNLEKEVEFLQAQLNNRRLRTIVKDLLLKIDEIIRLRIERLNKPKPKGMKKLVNIDEDAIKAASTSRGEMLDLIRKNDLINFYSSKSSGHGYRKAYPYSSTLFVYVSIRKIIANSARLLLGVVRRLKKGAR